MKNPPLGGFFIGAIFIQLLNIALFDFQCDIVSNETNTAVFCSNKSGPLITFAWFEYGFVMKFYSAIPANHLDVRSYIVFHIAK